MNTGYKFLRPIVLLMAIAAPLSCDKDDYGAPDKDKYIYDIPQTNLDADVVAGAYYSNYKSAVNQAKSPEEPLLGYYKTSDDGVMDTHISWADQAALDFFIFNWDASADDKSLIDLFNSSRTEESRVKYVLRYNTSHLKVTNDEPLQSESKYKQMLSEFIDEISVMMASETYYKLPDGRPVVIMTPANLSSSALLSIDYSKVIPSLKADMRDFFGLDLYIIGEMTTGWVAPVNYADHQVYSFDAVSVRDWKTRSYDVFFGYFSFLDINWDNWKTTLAKREVDFVPCIYPSYNDRVNTPTSYYYTFSEDGDTEDFVNFCNVAKRNIGSRNIVLMNSWNDWVYGTNLEPSTLKETRFLEETRSQFKL